MTTGLRDYILYDAQDFLYVNPKEYKQFLCAQWDTIIETDNSKFQEIDLLFNEIVAEPNIVKQEICHFPIIRYIRKNSKIKYIPTHQKERDV